MSKPVKAMPTEPHPNMVNAAYMLLESMPLGSPERHKKAVAEIWRTMAAVAPKARAGGLTPRMRQALEVIAEHIAEHGQPPTYAEIGRGIGRHKSDVGLIVRSLRARGFITFKDRARNSIRILIQPGEAP